MVKGPSIVVKCDEKVLENMDAEIVQMHTESGLLQAVKESKVSLEEAQQEVLKFLEEDCKVTKGSCPLAGNGLQETKLFLQRNMVPLYEFTQQEKHESTCIDIGMIREQVQKKYP